jgi:hypothetical protein
MSAIMCSRCAAPLSLEAAKGHVPCPHCGALNVPDGAEPDAFSSEPSVNPDDKSSFRIGCVVIICFAGLLVGLIVWIAGCPRQPGKMASSSSAPKAKILFKPSELRDPSSRGWMPLEVAPPAKGYAAFEAVANLPWALAIAQQWAPDARLERIDVDRLRPDGTLNTQDDPESRAFYRFLSPSLLAEYRRQADLGKTELKTSLHLNVKMGGVEAASFPQAPGDDPVPPYPELLPMPKILEAIDAKGQLPQKPYYNGMMIFSKNWGWYWSLATLSNQDRIPIVTAKDGALK